MTLERAGRLAGALLVLAAGAVMLGVTVTSLVQLAGLLLSGQAFAQGQRVATVMLAAGTTGLVLVGCCDWGGFALVVDRVRAVLAGLVDTVANGGRR
jgi:hypothetical protein